MNHKEKILSQATMIATLPFLLVGVYGLISGHYLLPSKHSSEVIIGDKAQLLSIITMLLAISVAAPEIIKLRGIDIQRYKKIYMAIQYGFVALLLFTLFNVVTRAIET